MIKAFKHLLQTVSAICGGVSIGSLLISQSDNWKWALPIGFFALTLYVVIIDAENSQE